MNGKYIVFGNEEGILYILNTTNKNNLGMISKNSDCNIIEIKFSPDSKHFAVTYFKHPDTSLCIYNSNNCHDCVYP